MRLFKNVGWLLLDKSRWLDSPKETTHNRICIKDVKCTETMIFVTSMRFPVLVNWHCAQSQANQQKIQNLEEKWCMKITSYRTFLGITGLSFPQSNFYIHCHLKILGLTKTAILIVKLLVCRYTFGNKSLVKSVA